MVNRRIIDQTEAMSLSGDDYLVADNSNLGTRKIQFTRLLSGATPLPPNYLTGFELKINSTTTISIASGYARSSDNLRNIQLSTNLIKDVSATFALGNNAGCMPSGLTLQANTKYYIFAISTAGGQTDIIVDSDENCANGLADTIVVSNNFDKFANIGYLTTDLNAHVNKIYPNSTKLNTDISNITDAGKTNIVNLLAVSSNRTAVNFPYTVEKTGMITCRVQTKDNIATEITVNGVLRFYGNIAGVRDGTFSIYVFPGDVVTGQGIDGRWYSPLKIYE